MNTVTPWLLDAADVRTRPSRYGGFLLACPACGHWRGELVLDGMGRLCCWPCRRTERNPSAARADATAAAMGRARNEEHGS